MADTGEAPRLARDAVVRPLARATGRPCARPACPAPALATLTFEYASRQAWLTGLADEPSPATYDLCASHAERTHPPHGWELRDRRPVEEKTAPSAAGSSHELGDEETVAVLAAALRSVPTGETSAADRGPGGGPANGGTHRELPVPTDGDLHGVLAELHAVAQGSAAPTEATAPRPRPRPVPAADRPDREEPARSW